MKTLRRNRLAVALAAFATLGCTGSAAAQTGACAPVTDAMAKLAATPHHQFMTETAAYKPGARESETINTGTTRYLKVGGKWTSHVYDAKADAVEIRASMANSTATCTRVGAADIDGKTATLVRAHNRTDDGASDQQVWIGANGLPLKQTIDIDTGDKLGKSHMEIRYDYANVAPPAA